MTNYISLDDKIDNLKAGESVLMTEYNGIKVTAERSSDGKTLRFVRTFVDRSSVVFYTKRFN